MTEPTAPAATEPAAYDGSEGLVRLPRRSVFPAQVWLVLAGSAAFLAWEPVAELGYHLFGPAAAVDLGEPGAYALEAMRDDAFATIRGVAGGQRATYVEDGVRYVVEPYLGSPVLVRRVDDGRRLEADTVERREAKGRLVKLDEEPSNVIVRMARPAARFSSMRQKFLLTMPPGRDTFLLLDGEAPRSRPWPLAKAFAGCAAVLACLAGAVRSARARAAYKEAWIRQQRQAG